MSEANGHSSAAAKGTTVGGQIRQGADMEASGERGAAAVHVAGSSNHGVVTSTHAAGAKWHQHCHSQGHGCGQQEAMAKGTDTRAGKEHGAAAGAAGVNDHSNVAAKGTNDQGSKRPKGVDVRAGGGARAAAVHMVRSSKLGSGAAFAGHSIREVLAGCSWP